MPVKAVVKGGEARLIACHEDRLIGDASPVSRGRPSGRHPAGTCRGAGWLKKNTDTRRAYKKGGVVTEQSQQPQWRAALDRGGGARHTPIVAVTPSRLTATQDSAAQLCNLPRLGQARSVPAIITVVASGKLAATGRARSGGWTGALCAHSLARCVDAAAPAGQ